jgi:hypothetical protein
MVSGDVIDKVAIIDEKIKTQRDNIDAARKALIQMDSAVDQTMSRSTTEQGADKAANLRRSQQRERAALQKDISTAQAAIAQLNDQRAPLAEVGGEAVLGGRVVEAAEKEFPGLLSLIHFSRNI